MWEKQAIGSKLLKRWTQSVQNCIPTQSVGTSKKQKLETWNCRQPALTEWYPPEWFVAHPEGLVGRGLTFGWESASPARMNSFASPTSLSGEDGGKNPITDYRSWDHWLPITVLSDYRYCSLPLNYFIFNLLYKIIKLLFFVQLVWLIFLIGELKILHYLGLFVYTGSSCPWRRPTIIQPSRVDFNFLWHS